MQEKNIIIALSKGRILQESLPLLEKINIKPADSLAKTRKLIINTNQANIKLMVVRSSDLPVYVRHGIASLGIVGKDVLLEQPSNGYYELADLKISPCKLMLASHQKFNLKQKSQLRIASKFTKASQLWLAQQGIQADIIKLNGAIELAVSSGLSDAIVDLVATGKTLKANNLKPFYTIAKITGRLIINDVAFRHRNSTLQSLLNSFSEAIN